MKHKHGGDVYSRKYKTDYSANINPLGAPESVLRAVRESASHIQNYPDVSQRKLKKALSMQEQVPEEWLIFGNGAAELIFALCLGLKPKRALLTAPGFAEYEEALKACGCEIVWYDRKEANGFLLEEDYLEKIMPETDILFLCNPNNPTGTLTDRAMLRKIADKCREYQVLMAVDECFIGFVDEPEAYSVKPWLTEYPNIFLLKAFTKLYAMPGLRLGYGICRDRQVTERMKSVMQPWSVSVPAQEAGMAALFEQEYVEKSRKLVRQERAYLLAGLHDLGLTVWEGGANFLFFKGNRNLAKACEAQGYLIRDCSNYRGLSEGYYRIAVRTREENEAFLKVLGEIIYAGNKRLLPASGHEAPAYPESSLNNCGQSLH